MGKKSGKKTHILCRRCGSRSYHVRKSICSNCGFGNTSKIRKYTWQTKKAGNRVK